MQLLHNGYLCQYNNIFLMYIHYIKYAIVHNIQQNFFCLKEKFKKKLTTYKEDMLTTCALASFLFSSAFGANVMVATFFPESSFGFVFSPPKRDKKRKEKRNVHVVKLYKKKGDSQITINVNLTGILSSGLPSQCNATQGFLYHVHSAWNSAANNSVNTFCNATFVGGHYDPYAACGAKTGNTYCKVKGGCINTTYSCSGHYSTNPYACEVGDWSGKYGTLYLSANNTLSATVSSFGDITGDELVAKSVVFHCANNAKPAFCAPFITGVGVVGSTTARRQTSLLLLLFIVVIYLKKGIILPKKKKKKSFQIKTFFFWFFFLLRRIRVESRFFDSPWREYSRKCLYFTR
ncbi:hypothetical protein RFI_02775, partial [Reticulomyxa filosa]